MIFYPFGRAHLYLIIRSKFVLSILPPSVRRSLNSEEIIGEC